MKRARNEMRRATTLMMLALITIALAANPSAALRAQTNSAESSKSSDTRADDEALRRAAAEAVEELKAARRLLERQGILIEKQEELLAIEKRISTRLKDLREFDEREKEELRKALAAKDRVIASLEDENRILKKKRFTFWKAMKIALIAGAAGIIAGKVLR